LDEDRESHSEGTISAVSAEEEIVDERKHCEQGWTF
jgi:hypothetical protein